MNKQWSAAASFEEVGASFDQYGPIDRKYIVFKREDLMQLIGLWSTMDLTTVETPRLVEQVEKASLTDAVVIRRQDHFAGPALHTYTACIAMVAKVKPELQRIADYFHEQAVAADATDGKFPD